MNVFSIPEKNNRHSGFIATQSILTGNEQISLFKIKLPTALRKVADAFRLSLMLIETPGHFINIKAFDRKTVPQLSTYLTL